MHKINVPYLDQSVKYPTGCESVSSVMLLNYLGYDISVDEFIDNYLECRSMKIKNGQLYGPDPNECFCGSPYDPDSYGIYAKGLIKALNKVAGKKYDFIDESGTSIDDLLKKYIDNDMPVIFWACINMLEEIEGPVWKKLDTDEEFCWTSNEHCMLLIGYDNENYYFNDPYDNNGVIGYEKNLVSKRHKAQKSMAIGTQISHKLD